jgi:DNA-binding protein HU-beta
MNKADLIEKVYDSGEFQSKAGAERAVELVFESIKESVRNGDKVSIAGFGIFQKKEFSARDARNPRTGEMVKVAAHGRVKFAPALAFKELVK